jgi:hypothetical protein
MNWSLKQEFADALGTGNEGAPFAGMLSGSDAGGRERIPVASSRLGTTSSSEFALGLWRITAAGGRSDFKGKPGKVRIASLL